MILPIILGILIVFAPFLALLIKDACETRFRDDDLLEVLLTNRDNFCYINNVDRTVVVLFESNSGVVRFSIARISYSFFSTYSIFWPAPGIGAARWIQIGRWTKLHSAIQDIYSATKETIDEYLKLEDFE